MFIFGKKFTDFNYYWCSWYQGFQKLYRALFLFVSWVLYLVGIG